MGGIHDKHHEKIRLFQFQGLRAIAFFAIFMSHSQLNDTLISLGIWGVSVFFCMSGF